jgi:stearoyl-CoA desaturase (Delta-9 desaturase)
MTVSVRPIDDFELGRPESKKGTDWLSAIPFMCLHVVPILVIVTGFNLADVVLALALYVVRMFFITAGYHRLFSHRSYKLSRVGQFAMALGGITAAQKGPLWWAGHHRRHHQSADTERDVHSPVRGFWWSHVGWVLSRRYKATDLSAVDDLARYPELMFLNRFQALGPWILGALCLVFFGWAGLVAFAVSTVLLWHATFAVNSLAHLVGRRRYETPDTSRNCWPIAILTLGEGWHNNHHHYPPSVRQGHRWWELDITWYGLLVMGAVGIATDMRPLSGKVLKARRIRDAQDA